MSDYKRLCPNWLITFNEWSSPRSEAPLSYHFWAGVYTLNSVLRRRVYIPKSIMGGWEIFPMSYIIFVAPPGKARKSTTAGYAEDLLSELSAITRAPSAVTVEMMLKILSTAPDNALTIFASEFASFVSKSEGVMYDILTDLFDGKKHYSVGTISRDFEFTEKPCINLLAATTPEWISDNMPESAIGGGFASRVIFVFEERVRRRQLYYEELDYKYLDKLRGDLISDLEHISNLEGKFSISTAGKHFMEQWYHGLDKVSNENYNARMAGYYERKVAHVHKLAMAMHLSESDELVLTEEDFKRAIEVFNKLEVKLPKTFQNIGKNVFANDLNNITEYIEMRGRVTEQDLFRKFIHVGGHELITKLLIGIAYMGKIKKTEDENGYSWEWRKG